MASETTPIQEPAELARDMRTLSWEGGPSPFLNIRLLRVIEERVPGFLARADILAGTSAGSFHALYLANRLGPPGSSSLAVLDEAIEFSNSIIYAFKSKCLRTLMFLSGWFPAHGVKPLQSTLQDHFGDRRIGDLQRKVVIVSYNRTLTQTGVIDNLIDPGLFRDLTLVDAGLRSSAFPTFLPIQRDPRTTFEYLDGAVIANNPTMCALTRAQKKLACGLEGLTMLSLGSRQGKRDGWLQDVRDWIFDRPACNNPNIVPWGWAQWLLNNPLYQVDLIEHGGFHEVNKQCELLLGHERCMAYAPVMNDFIYVPSTGDSGDPKKTIQRLDDLAEQTAALPEMELTIAWIKRFWMQPPACRCHAS